MASTRHPEEILQKIGGCGRFQKFLSIVSHLLKFPTVITMGLMVFSIATPKWWCVDNLTMELLYNSSSNQSSLTYRVFHTPISNISFDKYMMNSSLVSTRYDGFKNCKNSNGSQCNTIKYSEEMETIVTEWSMSCHLSWIPSTIASVQMIGLFIGNILSGHIADMFGRKIPVFGSLIVLIIANLIAYFANSWIVFGVARTLSGLGMGAFLTAQYSLATEVSLSKWRPMIIGFPSWASMGCVITLVNYLLPNWRKMHLLAAIVTVPFLVSWKFVPESFRWHLSHDRFKEAKDIIQRIAKINGERVSDETLMEFLHTTREGMQEGDKKKYTVFHLFKKRYLVKITLLSATIW